MRNGSADRTTQAMNRPAANPFLMGMQAADDVTAQHARDIIQGLGREPAGSCVGGGIRVPSCKTRMGVLSSSTNSDSGWPRSLTNFGRQFRQTPWETPERFDSTARMRALKLEQILPISTRSAISCRSRQEIIYGSQKIVCFYGLLNGMAHFHQSCHLQVDVGVDSPPPDMAINFSCGYFIRIALISSMPSISGMTMSVITISKGLNSRLSRPYDR